MALHHASGRGDPLEESNLAEKADTTLVLGRDAAGFTLHVRGRDMEEKENALSFAAGAWTLAGDATEARRSDQRAAILAALRQAGEAMSPGEIADVTDMKNGNVRKLLFSMGKAGEVVKAPRGGYLPPEGAAPEAPGGVIGVTAVTGVTASARGGRLPRHAATPQAPRGVTAVAGVTTHPLGGQLPWPAAAPQAPHEVAVVTDVTALPRDAGWKAPV